MTESLDIIVPLLPKKGGHNHGFIEDLKMDFWKKKVENFGFYVPKNKKSIT